MTDEEKDDEYFYSALLVTTDVKNALIHGHDLFSVEVLKQIFYHYPHYDTVWFSTVYQVIPGNKHNDFKYNDYNDSKTRLFYYSKVVNSLN